MRRKSLAAIGISSLFGLAATFGLLVPVQQTKLTASDGQAGDLFGTWLGISGDNIIIGAQDDDDKGINSGSAYIFHGSGSRWRETAKLTASNGAPSDSFGFADAISDDTAIVGAPGDDVRGANSGSAYIFQESGSRWRELTKLAARDGADDDRFGWAVELSADTAVVGAPFDDELGSDSGSVYIFERDGQSWSMIQKLTASDGEANDEFGFILAIEENTLVVGAPARSGNDGSAYVFQKSDGIWSEAAKLSASDGTLDDWFGFALAISGDTVIVSAPHDDDLGINSGSAYVYQHSEAGWTEVVKLTASDGAAGDQFGHFEVGLDKDTFVIGAPFDDDLGEDSGAFYVFHRDTTGWLEMSKVTASDGAAGDQFGTQAVIQGNTIVIGAWFDDDKGIDSGSVYVFGLE